MEAALIMAQAFPHVDFRREVTIGHLLADFHTASGIGGKVNPPLRSAQDVERLWQHVLAGEGDWVVSDHACCRDEMKFGEPRDDVFAGRNHYRVLLGVIFGAFSHTIIWAARGAHLSGSPGDGKAGGWPAIGRLMTGRPQR